jgi:DNA-binding GntR family transcriptional regulator
MTPSKTEQAYEGLRRDILSGDLRPGQTLAVSSLKKRYGLGWTPLRDALARLEREFMVSFAKNRGYRVASSSYEELCDLQAARLEVEGALLRASIRHGTIAWEQEVVVAHYMFSKVKPLHLDTAREDLEEWDARHSAFHAALLNGNELLWLKRFSRQINDQLKRHQHNLVRARASELANPTLAARYTEALARITHLDHHTRLMEAAIARDQDKALSLLTEHIGLTVAAFTELTRFHTRPPAAAAPLTAKG